MGKNRKQMLVIGKLNTAMKDINKNLSDYMAVQMCPEKLDLIMGIMQMSRPDIILISLIGLEENGRGIFTYLELEYQDIPILCLGNEDEFTPFAREMERSNIKKILRPVRLKDLMAEIVDSLGIPVTDVMADRDTTDAQAETEKSVDATGNDSKKMILLIDDAPIQLRAMNGILSEKYAVKMATSGEQAIKILQKYRPDLILLDYEMPGCDGRQTFANIRKEENGKDVPVVFVTGVKDRERVMDVLEMKPAAYLRKPVERDTLLEMAQRILGDN